MAKYTAKKVRYLFDKNEAAWQSPFPCACFVYAQFMRNLVVAFHVLRRMILIDPTDHQRDAHLGQILVVFANEPPEIIWIWSSRQVCEAQSTAANRAAACTFVMASWGGALRLDQPSTRDGWRPDSSCDSWAVFLGLNHRVSC
jgi:hypothetical protein